MQTADYERVMRFKILASMLTREFMEDIIVEFYLTVPETAKDMVEKEIYFNTKLAEVFVRILEEMDGNIEKVLARIEEVERGE